MRISDWSSDVCSSDLFTTDRGAAALNDYARANDPFTKVGRQQISVEVSSVIRASPDSFRVAWTERHYENGQLSTTERWTAIITIVIQIPRNADRSEEHTSELQSLMRRSYTVFCLKKTQITLSISV